MWDSKGLAKKVKVLRAERGWTQKQLAEASGVSACTIGLLESKKSEIRPSISTLVKLACALGVDKDELIRYM